MLVRSSHGLVEEGNMDNGDVGVFGLLVELAIFALFIASGWKIFEKAGKPGWAAIIPIYNIIVLLEIIGRPIWWIILMFIPLVNIVIFIIVSIDLSKSFGRGTLFGLGLCFLSFIFYPILGFGSDTFRGPAAAT